MDLVGEVEGEKMGSCWSSRPFCSSRPRKHCGQGCSFNTQGCAFSGHHRPSAMSTRGSGVQKQVWDLAGGQESLTLKCINKKCRSKMNKWLNECPQTWRCVLHSSLMLILIKVSSPLKTISSVSHFTRSDCPETIVTWTFKIRRLGPSDLTSRIIEIFTKVSTPIKKKMYSVLMWVNCEMSDVIQSGAPKHNAILPESHINSPCNIGVNKRKIRKA